MTALNWIVKEAKKLKKAYPKRFATWKEYVAQASAIYASKHKKKSPVGKKKIGAVKSGGTNKSHKDTKSHNVNIKVVSGYTGTFRKGKNTTVHYTNEYRTKAPKKRSILNGTKKTSPGTFVNSNSLGLIYPQQKEIVVGKIGDVTKIKSLDNLIPNVKVKISRGRKYYGNTQVTSDIDVVNAFRKYFTKSKIETQEFAAAMFLDTQLKIIGVYMHTQGGLTSTVVDRRLILSAALQLGAVNIILAHNHPSGNLKPSAADIEMTKEMVAACKKLDLNLTDHVIITANSFTSIRQGGYFKW
jgi:DNA repair protein RadC